METDRSVPSIYMSDIEYSVKTNDVIKSFDCIYINLQSLFYVLILFI